MPDLRWKGRDRAVLTACGWVMERSRGEHRPLKRVALWTALPGCVILTLECGHEVIRVGSPSARCRCEFCYNDKAMS